MEPLEQWGHHHYNMNNKEVLILVLLGFLIGILLGVSILLYDLSRYACIPWEEYITGLVKTGKGGIVHEIHIKTFIKTILGIV